MSGEIEFSGLSAQAVERVRQIYASGRTGLPAAVLEDAREPTSPLHGYFEWDDGAAAEAYRLNQAGQVVRRVMVTVIPSPDAQPIRVRAYVARREIAQKAEDTEPGEYIAIEEVAGATAYELSLRDSIKRDLLRIRRKYDNTDALLDLAAEVFAV